MTVKGINVKSLLFAGFVASYLMFFIDKWFGGFIGLFGAYPGTSSIWWMVEHHIDGIIFALAFAWPFIYKILPGGGCLKGLIFGLAWTIALGITALIAGALGAELFKQMPMAFKPFVSNLLLHMAWGFFLGILYTPPKEREVVTEGKT
jgi:hypothetical protein